MAREGMQGRRLQMAEYRIIFDLASEGKRHEAINNLSHFHRITISRAYNIAEHLLTRGTQSLEDDEAEQIATKARYDTSASFVQTVHRFYVLWQREKDDIRIASLLPLKVAEGYRIAKHREELTELAGDLLSIFEDYFLQPDKEDKNKVLIEKYNQLDWNFGCRLLEHMRAEFPEEFRNITDWLDVVKVGSGHKVLLCLATVKEKKTFTSKCQICQD